MIRKSKTIGLTFMLLVMAIMGGMANAQAAEIHVGAPQNAVILGEQTNEHVLQIAGGISLKCAQALFEGTVQGGSPQITAQEWTLTGQYANCKFAGLAAQVTMNGCKFRTTGAGNPATTFGVDITGCTPGKMIQIHVPGCTINYPEQHNVAHVLFTLAGNDVTGNVTLNAMKYELEGIACPHGTGSQTNDGVYQGKTTFQAFSDKGNETVTLNGHQYLKPLPNLLFPIAVT